MITDKRQVITAGVWDCLSARITEAAGFDFVSISGYGVAASLLGQLDIGMTTMTEMVNVTKNIARCVRVPVLTDCEQGYGNQLHMIRTIQELRAAGAQGALFDDKIIETCPWLPDKAIAERYNKGVISEKEMVARIKAAAHAKGDSDFVILFRTNIRGTANEGPVGPAIERSKLAVEAGADIIHFSSKNIGELPLWDDLGVPLEVTMSHPYLRGKTFEDIRRMAKNIRVISLAALPIRPVANFLLTRLKGVISDRLDEPLRRDEMSQSEWLKLFRVEELDEEIREFIPV